MVPKILATVGFLCDDRNVELGDERERIENKYKHLLSNNLPLSLQQVLSTLRIIFLRLTDDGLLMTMAVSNASDDMFIYFVARLYKSIPYGKHEQVLHSFNCPVCQGEQIWKDGYSIILLCRASVASRVSEAVRTWVSEIYPWVCTRRRKIGGALMVLRTGEGHESINRKNWSRAIREESCGNPKASHVIKCQHDEFFMACREV